MGFSVYHVIYKGEWAVRAPISDKIVQDAVKNDTYSQNYIKSKLQIYVQLILGVKLDIDRIEKGEMTVLRVGRAHYMDYLTHRAWQIPPAES